jgi:hypothetical protein
MIIDYTSWQSCKRCKHIPASSYEDRISGDGDDQSGLTSYIMEMPEMKNADLSGGYKMWTVACELCGTKYLAEVDVEPFVWDISFKRESNGKAMSQFGEMINLREDDE